MALRPANRPVTIYEVADRAQVSISTVSNVLNKPERVKAATRERVLAVADELGFVPKAQAVTHARQGTGRVGVMAPFTSYASYLRRLAGVLRAASEFDWEVVVFDHESTASASSPALASMPIRGRLDGLLVMGLPIEEAVAKRFHERGLPTVVVDADSEWFSRVVIDDVEGGRIAARYLLNRGHTRLGYILERQAADYESQALRRLIGFKDVAAGGGCDIAVEISGNSVEEARSAALRLLQRDPAPSVIMAHHDLLAIGALLAARALGLSVPGDVAVMGFDDGDLAVAADLTTVRQPFEESGEAAVRLLRSANDRSPQSTLVLGLEIVERSTT